MMSNHHPYSIIDDIIYIKMIRNILYSMRRGHITHYRAKSFSLYSMSVGMVATTLYYILRDQ